MRFDYLSIPKLQAPPHKILEVVSLTIVLKILLAFNLKLLTTLGARSTYSLKTSYFYSTSSFPSFHYSTLHGWKRFYSFLLLRVLFPLSNR